VSSSDAQRFRIRADSLLAAYYPRYYGYYEKAIGIYTHVSDQYSVYSTKAISCNPREALYVLDGLLENNTILKIREHTTDTHGYTEIVFALCYLLGYYFMPRIRDLKDQQLYRVERNVNYGVFTPLRSFTTKNRQFITLWKCSNWASMKYLLICCVAASLILNACSTPSQRFERMAREKGFKKTEVIGSNFPHVVYHNGKLGTASTLHVYLGGDGTPWIGGFITASDPTPRKPVVLKLMALDESPSLMLGRPCYHGYSDQPPCLPSHWTSARYAEDVVDSMVEALGKIMSDYGYTKLHLFGFSGGGGLAMLIAERFPQTQSVVTIAGNLDIKTWVDLHGYDPLYTSINPKVIPPLPTKIGQYHLAGGKDTNIPPHIIRDALVNQPQSQFLLFEDFTHGCCWEDIWVSLLNCVDERCNWHHIRQRRIGKITATPRHIEAEN
jgi:hypothetical protein